MVLIHDDQECMFFVEDKASQSIVVSFAAECRRGILREKSKAWAFVTMSDSLPTYVQDRRLSKYWFLHMTEVLGLYRSLLLMLLSLASPNSSNTSGFPILLERAAWSWK